MTLSSPPPPGKSTRVDTRVPTGPAGAPAGDLWLQLQFKPHPGFRFDGNILVADLPLAPWEAPPEILSAASIVLGQTYPMRMVDHMAAAEEARTRIAAVRRAPGHASAADDIQARHGSRRSGIAATGQRRRAASRGPERKPAPPAQLSLDLGLTHAS